MLQSSGHSLGQVTLKIISFDPPAANVTSLGLTSVCFRNLGRLVALAGPNGGGKSRIFTLLRQLVPAQQNRVTERSNLNGAIRSYEIQLDQHTSGSSNADAPTVQNWTHQLRTSKEALTRLDCVLLDEQVETINIVNFVPKTLDLVDPATLLRGDLIVRAERALSTGVDALSDNAFAYIQNRQDRYWEVTHPNYPGKDQEKRRSVSEYQTLCSLIESLLGTTVSRTADGVATIFGKPLGSSALSDGQKVLIQLTVAVHPTHDDHALVIMMDEPENHLHPAALIAALDSILTALPNAQIWIATHSVPLLAHLYAKDRDCLHFVAEGAVTFAGTKPDVVLKGLIGDEEEQTKLLKFIDLPHSLAASQFAAACLRAPTVAEHRHNDVQLAQIRDVLTRFRKASSPLKILDIGAGKGRLLGGLAEGVASAAADLDYVAYDSSSVNQNACERQIAELYSSAQRRWYSIPDQLFAAHPEGRFDVVVMCNVLHEIEPEDWLAVLGPNGMAYKALSTEGYLLVIEDLRVPVGELPNARGFFLLDTIHLQKLFNASTQEEFDGIRAHDARGDGRLKAHIIPKQLVGQATAKSRTRAIEALRETAIRELKDLRGSADSSYKAGHLNGLWSQQFANCSLYLQTV
jgi:energy-coupling factor transporter ATP-binding protein EcfA2/SAM-dependent methyltransferase